MLATLVALLAAVEKGLVHLDLLRKTVAVNVAEFAGVEIVRRHVEQPADLLQARARKLAGAFLVFLYLLKRHAEALRQHLLRHAEKKAAAAETPADPPPLLRRLLYAAFPVGGH